jgi:hypothetical protein
MRKNLDTFVKQYQDIYSNRTDRTVHSLLLFLTENISKVCNDTIQFEILDDIPINVIIYMGLEKNSITTQLKINSTTTPFTSIISSYVVNSSGQIEFTLSDSVDFLSKVCISTLVYDPNQIHKWYFKLYNKSTLSDNNQNNSMSLCRIEIL